MSKRDPAFEERLYQEYGLRRRIVLIILLSAGLYFAFLALDRLYAPDRFPLFLAIRLVVLAAHAVLLVLVGRVRTNRGCVRIAEALAVFDVAGIALMIFLLGGFTTTYVQGLYIIIIGLAVAVPLTFRDTLWLYLMIWLAYAVPSFLRLPAGRALDVVNNLFFMTSMIIIGSFGSYVMDAIRRRELLSRIRLEETTLRLQEMNTELKQLDELKTQFFSNVNHELRTPLTLMLAPLGPVLEGRMGPVTDEQKETFETIRRNGFRLLKLINNLLDLSKLEVGEMRLKVRPVDFIEFLSAQMAAVKPLADRKAIKLFFQHPPTRIDVAIDPDQFEKVVMNLLSNAIKFTDEKGRITVYLEEREDTVQLTVEDTGIGIPALMLAAIFDRFRQVDGSPSRPHQGTGIGLALAREIVLLHRATIHAESDPGRGSRFIVELRKGAEHFPEEVLDRRQAELPVAVKKRASDQDTLRVQDVISSARDLQLIDLEHVEFTISPTRGERKYDSTLLVIDDNPEVLKLMRVLLGDEFNLDFATSAQDGLNLLRERTIDLVLCDVMMPSMDGHQFCRAVKADDALKHTPVLLVTARSGADLLVEGIDSGADDYIVKPFNASELKARIRSHLRTRQIEAELALANRNLKMRTADLVERQRALFIAMVKSLVSALEAKDIYTRHHSARVTEFTLKIAARMGFGPRELEDLELAGLLHDIGKIGVPESILNKTGELTEPETAAVREHTVHGESILKPAVELAAVSKIVRSHHERYDGKGYPDGLRGLEIPLGARIMAVADAYDAITSKRPYRGEESHFFAVKEIIKCSGQQFDPEVVQHFIEVAKEFSRPVAAPGSSSQTNN